MADSTHFTMFPMGADKTPYRKLTGDYVSVVDFDGKPVLKVDPEALTLLAEEAFGDINHLLRPDHLGQLAKILDDPEASDNDRFVALDLLKNALELRVRSGGVVRQVQAGAGLAQQVVIQAVSQCEGQKSAVRCPIQHPGQLWAGRSQALWVLPVLFGDALYRTLSEGTETAVAKQPVSRIEHVVTQDRKLLYLSAQYELLHIDAVG